jgi:hypothetical protein
MIYFNIAAFALIIFLIKYNSHDKRRSFLQLRIISADRLDKIKPAVYVIICAFALFSRVFYFPGVPAGVNQDEAMAAINAKALLTYGSDFTGLKFPVYLPAWGSSQMNILESILMMPSVGIFGMNAFAIRLPMLLVSLASAALIYDFTGRLFGCKGTAAACAFIIAVNPWHIMLSRWGLESNLFPACLLFAFYFLYRGAVEKKPYMLYISMFVWGVSMYAYGIAYFATPFILAVCVVYFVKNKYIGFRQVVICALVYFAVSLPIFLMMFVNYFKLQSFMFGFMTIPYFPNAVRMNDMIINSGDIVGQARNNFLYIIRNIMQYPDVPWNFIPEFGTYYIFSLPLVIYGYIKMPKNGVAGFIIKLWLAASFLTGIIINTAGTNQINILFMPVIILCAIGLKEIIQAGNEGGGVAHGVAHSVTRYVDGVGSAGKKQAGKGVADVRLAGNDSTVEGHASKGLADVRLAGVLPVAAYVVAFILFLLAYHGKLDGFSAYGFYKGFGESVAAADRSGGGSVYITTRTQHENSAQVSEVLTLFHCDIDSRYYRGEAPEDASLNSPYRNVPYAERYKYVKFTETPEYDVSSAYVFNVGGDGAFFPDAEFDITVYGEFATATRKTQD